MDMIKFKKVAARMDSPNENEADTARKIANKMLKEAGKTWTEVMSPARVEKPKVQQQARYHRGDPFGSSTFTVQDMEDALRRQQAAAQEQQFPFGGGLGGMYQDRERQPNQQRSYSDPFDLGEQQRKAAQAAQAQRKSQERQAREDAEFREKVARVEATAKLKKARLEMFAETLGALIVIGSVVVWIWFK